VLVLTAERTLLLIRRRGNPYPCEAHDILRSYSLLTGSIVSGSQRGIHTTSLLFRNKLTKSVTKAFIEMGIAIVEKNIEEVKKKPEIIIEGLEAVQIKSLRDILKYV
jgi:hypothetical protein